MPYHVLLFSNIWLEWREFIWFSNEIGNKINSRNKNQMLDWGRVPCRFSCRQLCFCHLDESFLPIRLMAMCGSSRPRNLNDFVPHLLPMMHLLFSQFSTSRCDKPWFRVVVMFPRSDPRQRVMVRLYCVIIYAEIILVCILYDDNFTLP